LTEAPLACELKRKVKAAEGARKHRIEVLREQIAATEKAIRRRRPVRTRSSA
jgi:hypothetical protein